MTGEIQETTLTLPPSLKSEANKELWTKLDGLKGQHVIIDGSEVERLGGECLETLIAARRHWEKSELRFEISNASTDFIKDLEILGARNLLPLSEEKGDA